MPNLAVDSKGGLAKHIKNRREEVVNMLPACLESSPVAAPLLPPAWREDSALRKDPTSPFGASTAAPASSADRLTPWTDGFEGAGRPSISLTRRRRRRTKRGPDQTKKPDVRDAVTPTRRQRRRTKKGRDEKQDSLNASTPARRTINFSDCPVTDSPCWSLCDRLLVLHTFGIMKIRALTDSNLTDHNDAHPGWGFPHLSRSSMPERNMNLDVDNEDEDDVHDWWWGLILGRRRVMAPRCQGIVVLQFSHHRAGFDDVVLASRVAQHALEMFGQRIWDMKPSFANGAKLLVPLSPGDLWEARAFFGGFPDLGPSHVIIPKHAVPSLIEDIKKAFPWRDGRTDRPTAPGVSHPR